jgi:uncharacterized membrane protein HdeD (DUF308 family)
MLQKFFGANLRALRENRGLILFEGILFLVLGFLAVSMPVLFTFATDLVIGMLLLAGGITQLFRTYKTWGMKGSWLSCASSLLTIIAGSMLITRPLAGIIALTAILAVYFFLAAIAKFSLSFSFNGKEKFWLFISGVVSLVLSVLIITGLPETAGLMLGLFVGIDFLFFGVMLLGFYGSLSE